MYNLVDLIVGSKWNDNNQDDYLHSFCHIIIQFFKVCELLHLTNTQSDIAEQQRHLSP